MDKWIIDKKSAVEAKVSITSDTLALKKWSSFERDVSDNPFYHPKHKRIRKLKVSSYPPGTYRYKKEPLRVVYYPDKVKRVVFPLEAGTATDMSYKKRSSK
jgi:mRNA-degrading endonuclease RelE of RelBE toxin-antitoxin system